MKLKPSEIKETTNVLIEKTSKGFMTRLIQGKKKNLKFALIGSNLATYISALEFRQKGHHVEIFQSGYEPNLLFDTEIIKQHDLEYLKDLGIKKYLDPHYVKSVKRIKYFSDGTLLEGKYQRPVYGVKAIQLSKALQMLLKEKNIIVHTNHKVSDINFEDNQYRPIFMDTEKQKLKNQFIFDYYIVIEDQESRILKNFHKVQHSKTFKVSKGSYHIHFEPSLNETQYYWNKNIQAQIIPSGNNIVEIAFTWDPEKIKINETKPRTQLFEYFKELEGYREKVELSKFKIINHQSSETESFSHHNIIYLNQENFNFLSVSGDRFSANIEIAKGLRRSFPGGIWTPAIFKFHERPINLQNKLLGYTEKVLSENIKLRNKVFKTMSKVPGVFNQLIKIKDFSTVGFKHPHYQIEDLRQKYKPKYSPNNKRKSA